MRSLVVLLVALGLTAACGGGGGGGGAATGGGAAPDDTVAFVGFEFLDVSGQSLGGPPLEDLESVPPTPGASLDVIVRFRFTGVPSGPFNLQSLPVFTTPADLGEALNPPPGLATIPAQGSYALVVDTAAGLFAVDFRPALPTAPLELSFAAPIAAQPGLWPGSVYTARVPVGGPAAITNLQGAGGEVRFGTTSNPAAFYGVTGAIAAPPALAAVEPADGTTGFYPGPFSSHALGAVTPSFPEGPADWLLTFDRALVPTATNLLGGDLDGDGLIDPSFVARARSGRLLVGHTLPAGTLGPHGDVPALSALVDGASVDLAGDDVLIPDVPAAGAVPALPTAPAALAPARDPGLVFAWLPVDGGPDQLTVVDHLLGDPSHAAIAAAPVDTGVDEGAGLLTLLDGRLVTFDAGAGRLVELLPEVERQRPTPAAPVAGPPLLGAVGLGDGVTGFRSAPFPAPTPEVRALLQSTSGRLWMLTPDGGAGSQLQRLAPIDLDGNGVFGPEDGLPLDGVAPLPLPGDYADAVFVGEHELLALDRSRDLIEHVDLLSGLASTVISDVGSFGLPLGGAPSPARCLGVGFLDLDLRVSLDANGEAGAVMRLEPAGILPFGAELRLLQRNTLTSQFGSNEVNADLDDPPPPLGFVELTRVVTSSPTAGPGAPVDDVFLEDFDDDAVEDGLPNGLNPLADWAAKQDGLPLQGLRASVGIDDGVATLGDFRPQPNAEFDPDFVYIAAPQNVTDQDMNKPKLAWHRVFLDTDAQAFPLADGSTPGVTEARTILGGHFVFRDFIIPEGVHVIVKGNRPLRITVTGRVQIDGLLDLAGTDGVSDDTFNSGFLPVPGGPGGAGGGRGGDGHPTRFDPNGPGTIDQYATPETGGHGMAPVVTAGGSVIFQEVGGRGGLSTVGYNPNPNGFPKLEDSQNTERQRPPGGGGGSFFFRGDQAFEGSGAFQVESESSWWPFSKCPTNNKQTDAMYGNEENLNAGRKPDTPVQCVYLVGTADEPQRVKPGGLPGDLVFVDDDRSNDYIGPGGELTTLIGGQGGGGGGSRIDSYRHKFWSEDSIGSPLPSPPAPPYYPVLQAAIFMSPTFLDAKGGGGGGGAGSVHFRCYGDIVIGVNGYIDASGGSGGGGELVSNSSFSGGGGGGSGGAIILEAAGSVVLEGEPGHRMAGFTDSDGDRGAALDVTGGYGRDARTSPTAVTNFTGFDYDVQRSDGGQGGFGLVQIASGDGSGLPTIEDGAYVFARKRTIVKLGEWTGHPFEQAEHDAWSTGIGGPPPDDLRYIDLMHNKQFNVSGSPSSSLRALALNGTWPPIIASSDGDNGSGFVHEWPAGSGQLWNDTAMMSGELSGGVPVVREISPHWVLKTYNGWDPDTFEEIGSPPGEVYAADDVIPFVVKQQHPDGTPYKIEQDGVEIFDPAQTIDRLPLVHPSDVPFNMGSVSTGTSVWLDAAGAGLGARDALGRTPPFFAGFHGTWNSGLPDPIPADETEGAVRLAAAVPFEDVPARFVHQGGFDDPGLFDVLPPNGVNPPYNDLRVDAPDPSVAMTDVITDNALVSVWFQGAYPVRPGSHVPDPQTLTEWVADPAILDGHPLVRFQVRFDLSVDTEGYPVGPDSLRPLVDDLRLRMTY